jgi:hypothetical protein
VEVTPASRTRRSAAALGLLTTLPALLATSSGPQPAVSGVPAGAGLPAEMTCAACHTSYLLNPDPHGTLVIEGLPERYALGAHYALTFAISHPDADRRRWGFQLTAVDTTTLHMAGSFALTDPLSTQIMPGGPGGRAYIEHSAQGTGMGKIGGHRWTFEWIAPEKDVGDVAFFGAGNASNIDGAQTGDRIFSPTPAPIATVHGPGKQP